MKISKYFSALFLIIICFLGLGFWASDTIYPQSKTTIRVDKRMIDLGKYKKQEIKKAMFTVKNTGNKDLIIDKVEPDCHCTLVDWPIHKIKPSKTAQITVAYDNSTTGAFQRVVKVFNNSDEGVIILTIRGKIIHE